MELILNLVCNWVLLYDRFYSISMWLVLFTNAKNFNVASYADDTAPHSCASDIPSIALELQTSPTKLFSWFKKQQLEI